MKFLSILTLLILASCGFTPLYGTHSGGSVKDGLDRVEIALIPDAEGVYLRNILIDNFYQNGYPASPDYVLEVVNMKEVESDLDITIDSEATRKQIKLTVDMRLKNKANQQQVLNRSLIVVSSYNVLGSQFTTRVSESDAREAALNDLARQIENQVALYLKNSSL